MKTRNRAAAMGIEANGFRGESGFALMAILIFSLIAGIGGLAFFAMSSYEFKSAQDRQHSSEAFNLADGAIERARGELLISKDWRGPVAPTLMGSGDYNLTVTDTVIGTNPGVLLQAGGFVGDGARGVEVLGEIKDVLESLAFFAGNNFQANGNLNVDGHIHINGEGYFGPGDDHLKSGTYDEGFSVRPPAISTHPDDFPNSTCYQVRIKITGPSYVAEPYIWDRGIRQYKRFNPITPIPVTRDPKDPNIYNYVFNETQANDLFGELTDVFYVDPAAPGDSSVVVDFGHPHDVNQAIANIDFNVGQNGYSFPATIINARFEGVDEGDNRIESCSGYWVGGNVTFGKQMMWEPRNCVALITNFLGPDQGQQPNAQGSLGTATNPALTYVTGTVQGIKGQLQVHGILISLCDIYSQGGPDVFHHPELKDCVPSGVLTEGSGFFQVREWREVGL